MSDLKKLILNPETSSVDAGEVASVGGVSYRGGDRYFVWVGSRIVTARSKVGNIQAGDRRDLEPDPGWLVHRGQGEIEIEDRDGVCDRWLR